MTYLDTGCFVKLYYPEADSAKVVALIQGKQLCHTPLHALEFVNALQLKVFFGNATAAQAKAASHADWMRRMRPTSAPVARSR